MQQPLHRFDVSGVDGGDHLSGESFLGIDRCQAETRCWDPPAENQRLVSPNGRRPILHHVLGPGLSASGRSVLPETSEHDPFFVHDDQCRDPVHLHDALERVLGGTGRWVSVGVVEALRSDGSARTVGSPAAIQSTFPAA